MVTRKDVAMRAKVSPALVSYVINSSNYVSKEKRDAVLKAMKELNYIPNRTARGLSKNKTYQIAVLRGSVLNDMFNDLLYSMESLAYAKGYTVSLITVIQDGNMRAQDSFVDDLIGRRFDAIFVANSSMDEGQINRLTSYGAAVLLYNTRDYQGLGKTIACLAPDYRSGLQTLVERVIGLGHRRIAFIPNLFYPHTHARSNHRYDGFVKAHEVRGLPMQPEYICPMASTIEELLEEVRKLFDTRHTPLPPTALYTDESVVAGLILKELRSMGKRVPEDVSLVTSSASTISRILTPSLTSVGVEPHLLAEKAVNMMVDLIRGKQPNSCLIPMTLYPGESLTQA